MKVSFWEKILKIQRVSKGYVKLVNSLQVVISRSNRLELHGARDSPRSLTQLAFFLGGAFLIFRSHFVLGRGPGFFGEVDIDFLKA